MTGSAADARHFDPNGIVTLLTDFGTRDPFVGAMKGRILGACPGARIVDLTHEVTPYRPAEAGFWLARLRRDFAPGTVHLSVVDPGVGTGRRLLAVWLEGQVLLAPDNGLLGRLFVQPGAEARAVSPELLATLHPSPSATFHGRDLFAPLAGRLAAGTLRFENLGTVVTDAVADASPVPDMTARSWRGEVLLVDRYGNLFSNLEMTPEKRLESARVRFGAHRLPWVRTYREAAPGSCVALVNAFGVLEAACVEGNAARTLGLEPGAAVEVDWDEGGA